LSGAKPSKSDPKKKDKYFIYINTSSTHLIFKSTIGFMELTFGPANLLVDLKLGCMEICMGYMCIISRFLKRGLEGVHGAYQSHLGPSL
jgi:hypothetical protein